MTAVGMKRHGTKAALSYQEVLRRDRRASPPFFGEQPVDLGTGPVSADRYTSRTFFHAEIEKVWLKTWQFVCREEDIPNGGDTHVFDLVGKTIIVVRQANGSLKALQNVCLHRGRKLVTSNGCKRSLRCPYHGLTWDIDGSFQENPFAWDFPQIDPDNFDLPSLRVESWAGFVFVNFNDAAPSLLEQMAPIPEHFDRWWIDRCYKAAHVAKVTPANWKATAEAFIESHHILATHPQLNPTSGYESGQYDVLSDHVTRFLTPSGLTASVSNDPPIDEARRIELMFGSARPGAKPTFPPEKGMTARNYAAEVTRRRLQSQTGYNLDHACDAELIDGIAYDFFPNFHIWGGYQDKIVYRFRPMGLDHEKTLMEVMLFRLAPIEGPQPPPARIRNLSMDEPWSSASELGFLASVYDQDQANLGPVQEGLRALGSQPIHFGAYLEVRCRNLHRTIDAYMDVDDVN